jgi:hypothetical protein
VKTTFVAHITVDTPDGADPATWMTAVERALRTADIVNPPGVTGIQLDCAEFEVWFATGAMATGTPDTLNCGDEGTSPNMVVEPGDPHNLDTDGDGIGCEVGP